MYKKNRNTKKKKSKISRIRIMAGLICLVALVVIGRLFMLMVLQHDFYTALAKGTHNVSSELVPDRGKIYAKDSRTGEEYPLAINRDYFVIYADTRDIKTEWEARQNAKKLLNILDFKTEDKEKKEEQLFQKLKKKDDPYEPIKEKVSQEKVNKIKQAEMSGINFTRKSYRYYPEGELAAPVLGFVGKNKEGEKSGRYGLEGYWNDELSGKGGILQGIKSASGLWVPSSDSKIENPVDGADLYLTVDRTVQYKACEILQKKMKQYKAESASLVIMNPDSGSIISMCNFPTFNPNKYNKVSSIDVFNNAGIFTPYEIGSIFKPVVMGAAINEGAVNPDTEFHDTGSKKGICSKPIRNSDLKVYDDTTMTGVLEDSINTGMVYVAELLGKKRLIEYIEKFSFGTKTGIGLNTEASGTIDSLYKNKGNKIDCYAATASFGQGITATPLQMAAAYSAIANGGDLMRPYIVEKIKHENGKVERTETKKVRKVLDEKTAKLLSGMLVNVVDSGHAKTAGSKGYYVAGKTGTAQISGEGGYIEETNHSFVGFAPVENPKFVMIVKFHKPERRFSASTAAPAFGEISDFLLNYYQIPPTNKK